MNNDIKAVEDAAKWKLVGHSYQIADTGDYDGHYEITNGKISLLTNEDDEELLQPIVDELNNSDCKFYQDDWFEFENKMLKEENQRLQKQQSNTIPEPTDKQKLWALEKIIEIEQKRVKELEVHLKELIEGYEQWEADIILNNIFWWPNAEKDALSGKLYDDMLLLQNKRNEAKQALNK
jgi:hypothetical protein